MLPSYSFKVNTVKNNKILFVNAAVYPLGPWGPSHPWYSLSPQVILFLLSLATASSLGPREAHGDDRPLVQPLLF